MQFIWVVFWWPRMAINKVGRRHKRTAEEPGICYVFADEDSAKTACAIIDAAIAADQIPDIRSCLTAIPCVIPETDVLEDQNLRHWHVQPCVGEGTADLGNSVRAKLPLEPVAFEWYALQKRYTFVAKSVLMAVTVTDPDGLEYSGDVLLPDCPTDTPLTHPSAEPCRTELAQLGAMP